MLERSGIKKSSNIDVDVRLLLANERTLLAWIRTALTVQAGGIVLELAQFRDLLS